MYGFANGHQDEHRAGLTNDIIESIVAEISRHPSGPKAIVGDLNGDPTDFLALQHLFDQGWVDVGSRARLWGKVDHEATCLAQEAYKANRRDYLMVNQEAFPLLLNFSVAS